MSEERDKFANDPDQGEEVEGHKLSPDEKFEKFADSSDDGEDEEVEAHKF